MHIIGADTERSLFRSRLRRRTLVMLSSLSQAYPRQLAQAVGIDSGRLRAIMYGRPPAYSQEDALITVGLVAELVDPNGRRYYAITGRGRRKARSLLARGMRKRGGMAREKEIP